MKLVVNQRGDTIVEVLISLMVIAAVLAGAFVVTSTSSKNVRSSQERSQALQLLQAQVEQLRAYAMTHTHTQLVADADNGPFCMADNDIKPYHTATDCQPETGSLYTYVIKADASPGGVSTVYQYTAAITWGSLTNAGSNQEQLQYRVPFLAP